MNKYDIFVAYTATDREIKLLYYAWKKTCLHFKVSLGACTSFIMRRWIRGCFLAQVFLFLVFVQANHTRWFVIRFKSQTWYTLFSLFTTRQGVWLQPPWKSVIYIIMLFCQSCHSPKVYTGKRFTVVKTRFQVSHHMTRWSSSSEGEFICRRSSQRKSSHLSVRNNSCLKIKQNKLSLHVRKTCLFPLGTGSNNLWSYSHSEFHAVNSDSLATLLDSVLTCLLCSNLPSITWPALIPWHHVSHPVVSSFASWKHRIPTTTHVQHEMWLQ